MNNTLISHTLTFILLSSSLLSEQITDKTIYNFSLKGGSLGLGIDLSTPINDTYSVRFNLNGLKKNHSIETTFNTFKGNFKIYTAGILIDYYPTDSTFRMSTGIYANSSHYDGKASSLFHSVTTHASYNKIAPYLGIGWGNDTHQKGWGFTLDIGAFYQGKANVHSNISILGLNFEIEEEVNKYSILPVIAAGVNYTF